MRTPQDDLERKRLNARGRQILQQKKEGGIVRPARSDGYVNLLNKYGTKQDNTEAYHFEREPIVPDMQITGLYEGNGLFAKIIDTPAEEALKHGFDLGLNDEDLDRYVEDALDGLEWEEKATTAIKWARLYGGSIIVMLVDDGRGLEEPLDWQSIKSIDELRVYERAVVQPDYASLYLQDYGGLGPGNRVSKFGRPEFYYVSSIYGSFKVHESRCLVFRNGVLPEQVTNSTYQMWGMPEFIRIRRSLRETVTAHTDSTKLLERSVQAIYKMKGLAQILATDLGDEKVLKRLEVIDMARGILNSLVIDSDGEDYDFKTFQFSGVRDVIDACCNMLSALTNIPQTILFGRSPAGMDATGQSDLENYYNFIERIQKLMLKANLRNLLDIIFRAAVTGGELDQIPDYHLKFNPLWSMSDTEQAAVEKTRADTAMVKAQTAQLYVDMQALDASEVRRKLASDDEFIVEDIISGEDDTDLLESVLGVTPEDVSDVEAAQMNEEQQQAPGGSEQSTEGNAQQTSPSVPAPAANPTQPPQHDEREWWVRPSPPQFVPVDAAAKDGGPGSGNFGHKGRPGKLGGSGEGGGSGGGSGGNSGGSSKDKKKSEGGGGGSAESFGKAAGGTVALGKDGTAWVKDGGDGYWMNQETGEIASDAEMSESGCKALKYEGSLECGYGGDLRQDVLNGKMSEFARHQLEQEGKVTITSEEVHDMAESVRRYGQGSECPLILAQQDPDHYKDYPMLDSLTKSERAAYAKDAENLERYIELSDKVQGSVHRGIGFNTAYSDPAVVQETLSHLREGETITMGHIASWSTNQGTADSYAMGIVDAELEGGENYAITYSVPQNKSAASLGGLNPQGECLSPKSAQYRVKSVDHWYDEDFDVHRYDVTLEEVG